MKKLNLDAIIKTLILLSFSVFYLKIILNNQILMYVHPRIIPFAVLGMISMFIIAFFLIQESFHNRKKKLKLKSHFIFIAPLIIAFFMQNISVNSSAKTIDQNTSSSKAAFPQNGTQNSALSSANSDFELYSGKSESNGQGIVSKKDLDIKNNIIQVNQKNFVFSIDEILGNLDEYEGKEIEITGFVYRDESLKSNEFIIGRFLMICCAADMQIAGIRCDISNLESYNNDTWVKLKGEIKKDTFEGQADPLIIVEHIEKDSNPDTSYVYLF